MEFNTLFTGKNYIELQSVDSTNNYAAKLLNETKVTNGTVILAHFQQNGRGQMGNEWHSVAGENIMTSVIYNFRDIQPEKMFRISKLTAVAVYETLTQLKIDRVKIKWPNDIYVGDKKISGLLIENKWSGTNCTSIIGIGLNVNQLVFGEHLNATSIVVETGIQHSLLHVLNILLGKLEKYNILYSQNKFQEINTTYLSNLLYLNESRSFLTETSEVFEGKITDVHDNGHLVIIDSNGVERRYYFKEVFVL